MSVSFSEKLFTCTLRIGPYYTSKLTGNLMLRLVPAILPQLPYKPIKTMLIFSQKSVYTYSGHNIII